MELHNVLPAAPLNNHHESCCHGREFALDMVTINQQVTPSSPWLRWHEQLPRLLRPASSSWNGGSMPRRKGKIKYSLTLWRQVGDFGAAPAMPRDAGDGEAKRQQSFFGSSAQEVDFDLPGLPQRIHSPSAPGPSSPGCTGRDGVPPGEGGHHRGGQSLSRCRAGVAQTQN